jgi:hypothetical protein
MGPAEANRKTVENIKRYLESGVTDNCKERLLEKHGLIDKGLNYESYIKITIPKTIYDQAGGGEELRKYLVEEVLKLLK